MSNDPLMMVFGAWTETSLALAKVMEQEGIEFLAPTIQLTSGKQGRLSLEIIDPKAVAEEKAA